MAYLMGQHINITGGSVKVRENKRCLVLAEIGAVPAAFLAAFTQEVHQLIILHHCKEFVCFR
ncbi:hypothetical protein D3C80_1690860 [compost metagenome]